MEITRNVIIDLLPLYAADELNPETRALVDTYLENEPELAQIARQMAKLEKAAGTPIPRGENGSLKTYRKARRRIILFSLILAGAVSIVLLMILLMFLIPV